MSTNLSELYYPSSSSSSLDPSDIIERYADSDINELSQPQISDLDAEVSRLLDHHSSGSESDDDSSSPSSPLHMINKRQESPKSHYEPTSVGEDDIDLPQPLPSDINTQESGPLEHHSIELDCQTTGTTHEAQLKDHYKVTSVRGSGGIVTAPAVKELAKDAAVTIHSGSIESSSKTPHLALRENLLTGKYLSLLQSQPEGLKPSPAGSLLGTPSASTCQLNGESDEYLPKPLSEELEEAEAANKELIEDEPPSPNEAITDSEDYSDSETNDSERGDSYDSEEEIEFKLQEGDSSPQTWYNEEELPSPLLIALATATYQSSHGSESSVSETKDTMERKRTGEGLMQSSNGPTSNSTEVDGSSVPTPSVSNTAREVISMKPLADKGHIPNIQDGTMMAMSGDSHIQQVLNGSGSTVGPSHSTVPGANVSQSPKIEDSTTVTMHGKKIKRFLPPKKLFASGGIEASEKATAHSGALMMNNAPTTLESRNEIRPQKCKWQTGPGKDNAPLSEEKFELQLEDLTITDSEVGSISAAGEALSPVTASHEVLPHPSTVIEGKSSSNQPPPGVPPSTSAAGLRRPLKGILKKSKGSAAVPTYSNTTAIALPESNLSSGSSEADSFERPSMQGTPSVSQQSTPCVAIEPKACDLSEGLAPLSSKTAPSEDIRCRSKTSDNSSSTISLQDLDRTLTTIHPSPSSATPIPGLSIGSASSDHPISTLPQLQGKLPQTENETNVARGDDDKANDGPTAEDNFKQHSTALLSFSPITSCNHQHTADSRLQPTLHSHASQPNKPPQEETDGLPATFANDLVDKVSPVRI